MKKVLFIDRDGTIVKEPSDYQLDSFEKLEFYPEAFHYLSRIAKELDYELVMVTNQDGLGTSNFPEESFWPIHDFIVKAFGNEGVVFKDIHIDKTYPHENADTRKPGIGMLTQYLDNPEYDIKNSFVIGDRITDVELAKNMGTKAFFLAKDENLGADEIVSQKSELNPYIILRTLEWSDIYDFLNAR
ncbi:MAG: histidinol-phosphatase [Bacteroidales bacterium]|nr:histidinol-phosphatase [Bacteroidales bacterium]